MCFCALKLKSALAVLALTTSAAWAADFERVGPPLVINFDEAAGTAGSDTSLAGTGDAVSVKLGYSTLLKVDLVPTTIVVGSEEVVDVAPVGAMLILTGKALGSTNLHLLDEEKSVIFAAVIEVVPVVAPLPIVHVLATGREPLAYTCGENVCTLVENATAALTPELGP